MKKVVIKLKNNFLNLTFYTAIIRFFKKNRLSLLNFIPMTFDNSKIIISLRIKLFVATVILLGYLGIVYAAQLVKFPLLGLSDTVWTLILVAVYLVVVFLPMLRNFQFVFYSDEGGNIVFKYFLAGIVGGKKNSVSITKKSFAGYKTESKYFGLSESIILFQKMGQGVAKYPPVYISALTKDQRKKLFESLNKYTPKG